jgi:sugar-specific transcriptional regulator TrmB
MHAIHNNSELVVSLEEFGLSKYEAKAYLTMVGKGPLAASEIAYYSNLPRTKVYPTLKKLEKKRLGVICQQKPLICSAVSPQESFGEIVELHERRLKNMKKIVEMLQRINDERQRPSGSEEKRYFILDPKSTLEKVENFITNSRASINAILDIWGLRLISQCKPSLIKAINNGINVRLLVANICIGNENLLSLPEGVGLKIGKAASNIIIIDSNKMISIDSSNGKAAVFTSIDIFGLAQSRNFEEKWNNGLEIHPNTSPEMLLKASQLIKVIENTLPFHLLEHIVNPTNRDTWGTLIKSVKTSGIDIASTDVKTVLDIVDFALRMCCSGSLKYDKSNNTIIIQSKNDNNNNKRILPWIIFLTSYFKHMGNESRIMQNSKEIVSVDGDAVNEIIHIKLSKPIINHYSQFSKVVKTSP